MTFSIAADFIKHIWEVGFFLTVLGGPIPLCCSIVAANLSERKTCSLTHNLLILLTSWCIIQVIIALGLGVIQQLHLGTLIGLELIIFAIGCLKYLPFKRSNWQFSIRHLFALNTPLNKQELLVVGALSFMGVILLERLATIPVTDYDSLWFHLPAMARWYQTHSFTLLDPAGEWIFKHPDAKLYPYNWEALGTLFLIPFGEDFLVGFVALFAWIMLGLSVQATARLFGAARFPSMAASSLVLSIPHLINQVNTLHVDMPLAAFFTVALYLVFSYDRTRSVTELSLLLAAMGMLLGLKITGLIYVCFIVAVVIILEIGRYLTRYKYNKSGVNFSRLFNFRVAIGVACLLFLGGFWYARNFVEIQNSMADMSAVKIASTKISALPGNLNLSKLQQSTLTSQFNPSNLSHWKTFGLQAIARLQVPFFAILGQVLFLPIACINRQNIISRKRLFCLLALLIGVGFLYWNTPYSSGTGGERAGQLSSLLGYNFRYGFSFLSVLGITAAVSATLIGTRTEAIAFVVLISSILGIISSTIFDLIRTNFFLGKSEFWGSAILDTFKNSPRLASELAVNLLKNDLAALGVYAALYIIFLGLLWRAFFCQNPDTNVFSKIAALFYPSYRKAAIALILLLIIAASFGALEKRNLNRERIYQGLYEYIELNLAPREKIGYLCSERSYLFYGRNLNQQVLHVPLKSERLSEWLDELRQKNVEIVAVGPLKLGWLNKKNWWQLTMDVPWLENSNSPFVRVFGQDAEKEPVFYRLKSSQSAKN